LQSGIISLVILSWAFISLLSSNIFFMHNLVELEFTATGFSQPVFYRDFIYKLKKIIYNISFYTLFV
jgi:indole-3-glycerol phosphate synthase